jgi:hypothetical protein
MFVIRWSTITVVMIGFSALSGVGFLALILISGLALALALAARHKVAVVVVENAAFLAAIKAMLHLGCHVQSPRCQLVIALKIRTTGQNNHTGQSSRPDLPRAWFADGVVLLEAGELVPRETHEASVEQLLDGAAIALPAANGEALVGWALQI